MRTLEARRILQAIQSKTTPYEVSVNDLRITVWKDVYPPAQETCWLLRYLRKFGREKFRQARVLDYGVDRAGNIARSGIGFEDGKSTLDRHRNSPSLGLIGGMTDFRWSMLVAAAYTGGPEGRQGRRLAAGRAAFPYRSGEKSAI